MQSDGERVCEMIRKSRGCHLMHANGTHVIVVVDVLVRTTLDVADSTAPSIRSKSINRLDILEYILHIYLCGYNVVVIDSNS